MIAEAKADARRQAFAARKAAHAAAETDPAILEAANAALLEHVSALPGAVVAGYMPIRTEISPLPAMEALAGAGRQLCVPVILGAGLPLEFHAWHPGAAMREGPFGAAIPAEARPLEPDILIVPLVAFDRAGYRLGYGGGFYDRSLARLAARKPVHTVGFAFAAQELPEVPREPTDWRLDAIVTENGRIVP